ncbi:hypothetical protein ACFE04_003423 [Oxalis oulophora]
MVAETEKKQQQQQQQSWNLRICAKDKNFDFKLKANTNTSFSPYCISWSCWKFQRLSILLRIRKFHFNLKSEPSVYPSSLANQPRRRASDFIARVCTSIHHKFQIRRRQTKKKTLNNSYPPQDKFPVVALSRKFPYEEPVLIGSVVFGILEILSKIFWGKSQDQIVSIIVLCIQLWLQKWRKANNTLLVYIMAATVICSVVLQLINTKISNLVWMAWKFSVSSGCFYAIFQEILSRICNGKILKARKY